MIKRSLFFANPAYLNTRLEQLVVNIQDKEPISIPIEDIGVVVLEHPQITISLGLLAKLSEAKALVMVCNKQHMPEALLQPMEGHTEYAERLHHQLDASLPLKKNLWAQTVTAKIINQGLHLRERCKPAERLMYLAKDVKSGDSGNHEAIAAAYYWDQLFDVPVFNRHAKGEPPNDLLNYGYAILRAVVARALVSSGMLPAIGIWHRNKYNAFRLADDIMEPYRPYVDRLVYILSDGGRNAPAMDTVTKAELLKLISMDVVIDDKKSPLFVAVSRTTNSLWECFAGISRKIIYPVYE